MVTKFLEKQISIKKFLKKKIFFYKRKNEIFDNLLFIDRERIDTIFQFSILSLALSNKFKLNTIILTDQKKESLILKIYKKLGYNKFISGFSVAKLACNPIIFFLTLYYFFFSLINTLFNGFEWLIKKFNINNIYIGDLIYDANIRYHQRFLNPRIDFYFLKLLFSSIFRFFVIKNYLRKLNIKKILVGTETGSRNHGLALRISSKMDIKNYTYFRFGKNGISIISHEKNYYLKGLGSLSKKNFYKISNNVPMNKIDEFYEQRKKFKTNNWYTGNDFMIANIKNSKGIKFLNSLSKTKEKKILFASHAFADAPHAAGKFIFNDYFEQFKKTLKFAYKYGNEHTWIFKYHPNSRILNEKKIFEDLILKYKRKNILLCPENVPVQKLLENCDVVITGRGTIGMEFAALGKKVISAGASPYSGLGIAHEAYNKKEYFYYLKNINKDKTNKKQSLKKIKKVSRQLIYVFENSLNVKTIKINDLSSDKNYKSYLNNVYQKNFNLNSMFTQFNYILSKNILESEVYKKIIRII